MKTSSNGRRNVIVLRVCTRCRQILEFREMGGEVKASTFVHFSGGDYCTECIDLVGVTLTFERCGLVLGGGLAEDGSLGLQCLN